MELLYLFLDGSCFRMHAASARAEPLLCARGLQAPVLVITDGAPGLIAAVDQVFPPSLRQCCLVHKAPNVLARVSQADQQRVKAGYWAIFDDIAEAPGDAAVTEAQRRVEAFAHSWERRYPGAVASVVDDMEALTAHLRCPARALAAHPPHQHAGAHLRREPVAR